MKWKDVVGYEGFYEVSENGLVRRAKTNRVLAQGTHHFGYKTVHLCMNGVKKRVTVHRILATAFIPNTENKPFINHINHDPSDNNLSNLEWCTQKENIIHSWKRDGRRNSRARYVLDCSTGKVYSSIKEATKETGYSYQTMRFYLSGRWPNNTSLSFI